ncbi:MAG: TIR domain-containing protein [Anaerolineales bacterium]|nr:TIR domain-containing protein [Anaerolineales bacterium]
MTDSFISYSRKDIAFARLLHQALKENDLETWIDWQDIPPSADWLAEVYEAIEQTDTFIFIISPTSVSSEICSMEIAHAAKHNKRLIPIVINDIDTQSVPSQLVALNWIFFKEEDQGYRDAIDDLIKAIQVDQAWVKEHTRLQNRALEWERKGQDSGFLLRGGDLRDGEAWLARAAEKDPHPTALQTRYMLASRQDATRRQRVTLGAVGVALVMAVGLGILAWTQRNVAVSEGNARATAEAEAVSEANARATEIVIRQIAQADAEAQRDLAISRLLGSQSLLHVDDQLELSLLLAVQASRFNPSLESRSSMLIGLTQQPFLDRILLKKQISGARDLVLSRDGKSLAVLFYSEILLLDLDSGQQTGSIDIESGREVWAVSFIGDSGLLASCSSSKNVSPTVSTCSLWDGETGSQIEQPLGIPTNETPLAFSPDGRIIALVDDIGWGDTREHFIIMWDASIGEPIGEPLKGHTTSISHVVFNPDGKLLASSGINGEIILWDVATGSQTSQLLGGHQDVDGSRSRGTYASKVDGIAFSPDSALLASSGNGETILWDVDTGKGIKSFSGYGEGNIQIAFSLEGQPMSFMHRNDKLMLWNAETGALIGGQPSTNFFEEGIEELVFSPDTMKAITAGRLTNTGGTVLLAWDMMTRFKIMHQLESLETFDIECVAVSPAIDANLMAMGGCAEREGEFPCIKGEIQLWDTVSEQMVGEPLIGHAGSVESVVFSPDGQILASGSEDSTIILWDVASHQQIGEPLTGHRSNVDTLDFSPDGTLLASVSWDNDQRFFLWDISTSPPKRRVLGTGGDATSFMGLVFSPDGKILATTGRCGISDTEGSCLGGIQLWDVADGEPISQPMRSNTASAIITMVFSPDGQVLVSGGRDGIIFWDVATRKSFMQPPSHLMNPQQVESLAYSHNGTIIASVNQDQTLTLWDAMTGQRIGNPLTPPLGDFLFSENNRIAFSPDDKWIATGGNYGVALTDVRLETWQDEACHIANRNLTLEEWLTYLGDLLYQETCPGS